MVKIMNRKKIVTSIATILVLTLIVFPTNAISVKEQLEKNEETNKPIEVAGDRYFFGVYFESKGPGNIKPKWWSAFLGGLIKIPMLAHWEGRSTLIHGKAVTTVEGFIDYEAVGNHEGTALGFFDIVSGNGRYEIAGIALVLKIEE